MRRGAVRWWYRRTEWLVHGARWAGTVAAVQHTCSASPSSVSVQRELVQPSTRIGSTVQTIPFLARARDAANCDCREGPTPMHGLQGMRYQAVAVQCLYLVLAGGFACRLCWLSAAHGTTHATESPGRFGLHLRPGTAAAAAEDANKEELLIGWKGETYDSHNHKARLPLCVQAAMDAHAKPWGCVTHSCVVAVNAYVLAD